MWFTPTADFSAFPGPWVTLTSTRTTASHSSRAVCGRSCRKTIFSASSVSFAWLVLVLINPLTSQFLHRHSRMQSRTRLAVLCRIDSTAPSLPQRAMRKHQQRVVRVFTVRSGLHGICGQPATSRKVFPHDQRRLAVRKELSDLIYSTPICSRRHLRESQYLFTCSHPHSFASCEIKWKAWRVVFDLQFYHTNLHASIKYLQFKLKAEESNRTLG